MLKSAKERCNRLLLTAALALGLVAGTAGLALAAQGDLDTSFGGDGKVTVDFNSIDDYGNRFAVQSDGKIVIAGASQDGAIGSLALTRLNVDGQLDASFGAGGKVVSNVIGSTSDAAYDVAIQPDGKIVVAGQSNNNILVMRYTSSGERDITFNENGIVVTQLRNTTSSANALALQSDGKILITGRASDYLIVVRYLPNGDRDSNFGSDGFLTNVIIGTGRAIAQYGTKILVAGEDDPAAAFAVLRFNSDGSTDTTFGSGGETTISFNGTNGANDMAIAPNGKIVVVGSAIRPSEASAEAPANSKSDAVLGFGPNYDFAIARLNINGTLDSSFGNGGKVTTDVNEAPNQAYGVTFDEGGKIVVAGDAYTPAGFFNFALARYNTNGSIDTSFADSGVVQTDFNGRDDGAGDVARVAGGKLVAVGVATLNSSTTRDDLAAARYQSCNPTFSDVRSTDFYSEPVRYLACAGVISGYGDNTFRPFANTTRSQLAKIVVGAMDWANNTSGGPHFSDVTSGNAFYSAIETAYNHGVISGYNDASRCAPSAAPCFKPFDNVTRAQLSKIVVTAQGWATVRPATATFRDVTPTNPFYEVIETAVQKGIISGYDLGGGVKEFRPGNNATRGQIGKIIYLAITAPGE